jgi:hypothetical protein
MTSHQTGLRAAGAWLAGALFLLAFALAFHGPLHPDLEVLTSTGRLVSAWAVVLVGALWTLTTAVTEATVVKDPQRLVPKWSAAVGAGAGLASFTAGRSESGSTLARRISCGFLLRG